MKSLVILGSTGSIGESVLSIVRAHRDLFRVVALSARHNAERLAEQAREFEVAKTVLSERDGEDAIEALAETPCDIVVVALVGFAGLRPTLRAIECGRDVALATKEVLVADGARVMSAARKKGVRILPLDSEHSAIFQCLQGRGEIEKLILTASGGPFFAHKEVNFDSVTPEEALRHPRWKMGAKISVDSATMMNKGLEIIEACHLFGVPPERVEVVIHPQSIIHSLVQFRDGSQLAQLGCTDMRLPILYALTYPSRTFAPELPRLDLAQARTLEFFTPDAERFPMPDIARRAFSLGGIAPAVMNAANEVAVARFLAKRLRFSDIPRCVSAAIEAPLPKDADIFATDFAARRAAEKWCDCRGEISLS